MKLFHPLQGNSEKEEEFAGDKVESWVQGELEQPPEEQVEQEQPSEEHGGPEESLEEQGKLSEERVESEEPFVEQMDLEEGGRNSGEMSEYEKIRKANIAEKETMLASLNNLSEFEVVSDCGKW